MSRQNVSAECREIKHQWCQGAAWDTEADALGDCRCDCHQQPKVTLYVPDNACVQCTATKRKLDSAGITYTTITVQAKDRALADEFKHVATQLGVEATFPVVHVFHPGEQEAEVWFGNQPTRIDSIKERRSA